MKSGVYKITHTPTGRMYVGSGLNIYYRLKSHLYHLKRGSHHNVIMQRTWDKEGESCFSFSPILVCRPEDRIFYEQLIMDGYRSHERNVGFNIRKVAESNAGLRTGSEKQRNALKKRFLDPEFRKKRRMPEPGERYGRLVLLELRERTAGSHTWLCKCDCGKETLKKVGCLRRGATTSCGCFNAEEASKRRLRHGLTGTKEFLVWQGMLARCYNEKNSKYPTVGAKGVKVCDRWRNSFENFLADVGPRVNGAMLRRADVTKDYDKKNCTWSHPGTFAKNKTNVKFVFVFGRPINLSGAARICGISPSAISQRIRNHKEAPQQATDHFVHKHCYRQVA